MKKVGKEFRKSLSAILAAAMVVSSMPETSLVANAEETNAQQETVYDVGEAGSEVTVGESTPVDNMTFAVKTSPDGDVLENVTATAAVVETDETETVYVWGLEFSGSEADKYQLVSVGGETTTNTGKTSIGQDYTGYFVDKTAVKAGATEGAKVIDVIVEAKEVDESYSVTVPAAAEISGATVAYYKNDNTTAETVSENKITGLKAGDTVTAKVTVPKDNGKKNTVKYQIGSEDVQTLSTPATSDANNDVFTFDVTIADVDVTITSIAVDQVDVRTVTVATANPEDPEDTTNADVSTIKYGKTDTTATTVIPAAGAPVETDSDYYFAVTLKDSTKIIKSVKYVLGDSTEKSLKQISDNVFMLAKTDITGDGKLVVETQATGATVALSYDAANVTVSYQVDGEFVTATGKTISLPKDTTSVVVKASVKDETKYMVSEYNITGDAKDTVELSAGTFTTGEKTVSLTNNKGSFTVKAEALAYDYTFDWDTAVNNKYIIRVDEDSVVRQISGNGTFEVGDNSKVLVEDDRQPLVVRVLKNKPLKFTVKSADEAYEVIPGEVKCGEAVAENWGDYYSVKSTANGKIVAKTTEIEAKAVQLVIATASGTTTGIKKITANVDATTGKRTTDTANQYKIEAPIRIGSHDTKLKVFPGVVATVNIEMDSNNFYSVDKIEYKKKDGSKVVIKDAISFTVDLDEIAFDGTDDITITTKVNEATTNKAVFTYDYNNVTVTPSTGDTFTASKKTASMLPDTDTSVSTGNSLTFGYTVKNGYTVKKITIGDKTYEGTELTALGTTGILVDFEKTEKTENNTTTYVSKTGQTVDVIIETEAPKNESDRRFAVTNNGVSKISYQVTTPGVTSYTKTVGGVTTTYYDIDKDAEINEVELVATAPKGYKLSASETIADGDAFQIVSNEENTVTYKIVTSKLAVVAVGETIETVTLSMNPNRYEFNLVGDVTAVDEGTVPINGQTYEFDKSWKVQIKSYEKLKVRKANDASGNEQWEVVPTDEDNVATVSMANIVDIDDDGAIDGVYYKVVNEAKDALNYTVDAEVDNVGVETPSNGVLQSVTVKGGETVVLTVVKKDKTNSKGTSDAADIALKSIAALDTKVYKSVISGPAAPVDGSYDTQTITITTDAKDAGLTIPVSIVNVVTANGKKSEVPVVDFEIVVAGRATEATVEGVKDGKLNLTVGQKTILGLTLDKSISEDVINDLLVINGTGKLNDQISFYQDDDGKTDYSKLVFDTTALKAGETSTVTVKCDSKTLTSFEVTGVAPEMGIKSVSSPSQGYNYINVTVEPETITRSTVNTNDLYYEFKVSPASGNTVTSATQYIYEKVCGYTDTEAKLFFTEPYTYKLDVNNAKVEDKKVGAYDVEVRMVVGSSLPATSSSASTNVLAGSTADTSLKAVSTKLPYVEDNLKVAKKSATVVANQQTYVNTVWYSDNASYVALPTFRVLNADGTEEWNSTAPGNEIDYAGDIFVKAPAGTQPGKYTVEVSSETIVDDAAVPNGMVASTATFTLTVKDGMNWISVPEISSIYLKSGKSATASFKATGYGSYDFAKSALRKTADQKFIYSVEVANKANEGKVTISKSGKLTVAKDFTVSSSAKLNKITVTVKPQNFDITPVKRDVYVTQEKTEIASIEFVDINDKNLGTSVDYDKIKNGTGVFVNVKDSSGKVLGKDDVTITPSTGNAYVYWEDFGDSIDSNDKFRLYVKDGKAPKSVTIKAVAKDGGKNSKSVKFTLGYKTDGKLDLDLTSGFVTKSEPTNNNFVISGNGQLITFKVYDGDAHVNFARKDIYNYAVKISGGKLVKDSDANDEEFTFRQTAKDVKITITDNAKKPKVVSVYTISNPNYSAEKAPKFKLVKGMKLFADVEASQKLTYNVAAEYEAVQINQVSYSDKVWADLNTVSKTSAIVPIKDGQFDLDFVKTSTKTGTIKYEAIFGNYVNGIFVPVTKAKEFSVKLTKTAKVVPETEYTVYYDSTASFEFKASPDYDVTVIDVLNDNVAGKYNNFAKYFVQSATNSNVIELKPRVIAAIKDAKVTTDINELVPEADRTGYIKYRYSLNGRTVDKQARVTVTFAKDGKVDGYVKADPTLSSSIVYAYGELVDNNGDPINIDSVYSTGDWTVTKYATGGSNALQFRSTKAVVGENTVTFKVLTDKSYYSAYSAATAEKYGAEVTATITVLDADTATGKLETKVGGAAIDLGGKTATQSWTTKTSTTGVGTYTNYVKLEDVFENVDGITKEVENISNLKITKAESVVTEGISAQLTQVDGEYVVEISVDQDKLTAGATSKVDVKFSFDNSKAAETITFDVKAPEKFYTLSDVAAALKAELEASNYNDDVNDTNVNTYVTNILDKYKATGITLLSSSVVAPTAPDTIYTAKAKIKSITDTTGDTAIEIEAALKPQGTKKKLADINAAYNAVSDIINSQIKDEIFKDNTAYTGDGVDQSNYLIVTAATTREDVRAFIQKEINEFTNGSEYTVTVPVNGFSKKAAQNYEYGTVSVKVYVTNGNKKSNELSHTYQTLYLKYVTPTTTP